MRTFLGVLAASMALAGTPGEAAQGATPLATLAASMAPGTWAELATNGFSGALLQDGTASDYITQYTDEAVWDSRSRQLLFSGQSHRGIGKFIAYKESTNAWTALPTPPEFVHSQSAWGFVHAYDHQAVDPAAGRTYRARYHSAAIYRYDTVAAAWTKLTDCPSFTGAADQITRGFEYFPEMGGLLVYEAGNGLYFYSESTGAWRTLATGLGTATYHEIARYNPVHRVVLFGGGNTNRKLWKVDASGTVTPLRDPPLSIGISMTIFAVDPVSGKSLVFGGGTSGPGVFYEYDLAGDSWTQLAGAVPPIFSQPGSDGPVFGTVAAPLPQHGVVMFVHYDFDRSKVFLYKHTASAPSAPTVTIAATDGAAAEGGGDTATLIVTRSGATSAPLTVNYSLGGTAGQGADYSALPGSVTIPAGSASAAITVTPIDDVLGEGPETVVATLSAGAGYAVGSPGTAMATIADNDPPPTVDSDGDGLPDAWEMQHFMNLGEDGTGDPDQDGATNAQEFAAGTDPMDPASAPGAALSGSGDGKEGMCGATGLEALLALALLRRRKR